MKWKPFLRRKFGLLGPPPYGLCYQNVPPCGESGRVLVELQSFRPDPENYLEKNLKYRGILFFETKDCTLKFLRKVIVSINEKVFTFYRF